jgi:pyrroline-5-carboxylate reductase
MRDIAFIGGGNMASAIIAGLRQQDPDRPIHVCDVQASVREQHAAAGLTVFSHIGETAERAGIVVLAVKPQAVATVLPELAGLEARHLVISILAGTTTATLEAGLPAGVRVIRAMPNTPMAIGQGMVGICAGQAATEADLDTARSIFATAAQVLCINEDQMDALTAISGSGPAYLFHYCEAMQAAAMQLGFDAEQAALLVGQTVQGSIAYLRSQDGFPAARLREQVTSPGGTTAAALAVFAEAGFPELVTTATRAACDRGRELAG